jgi:8-oxo-dGTP diphosphatase
MTDAEPKGELPSQIQLAGAIIQNPEGKILLIHRNTSKRTQWEVPGGKVGDNIKDETPEETVLREIREELGIEIEIKGKAGEHEFSENGFTNDYSWYNAVIISGEPKPMEEGHDNVGWFSWEELRVMNEELSANLRNLVDAKFAGQLQLSS